MIETIRNRLRLTTEKFDDEIENLKNACLKDLGLAGAEEYAETDPLVLDAVVLYCKANFGFYEKSDMYYERYKALKTTLANSSDYQKKEAE